ncbi:ester cyclase [Maribacter sp. 2210JD10-5]|uniref:ester cyclase n=1 Tax=Maribacter sp. 2210JD10-5 TaxID=3386272 RepID=UPI0039BD5951
MKSIHLALIFIFFISGVFSQEKNRTRTNQQEINKEIARNFYQDLWFTNNTNNYKKYVADEYVVHDIGDRKNVKELAITQKNIADSFWENGYFNSKIDYQIAEDDLVMTRWTGSFTSNTLFGRIALETKEPISIINVFKIKDGKIVEFWNHRHDIETPQTLKFTVKGFAIGLLIALIPIMLLIRVKRKLKVIRSKRQ